MFLDGIVVVNALVLVRHIGASCTSLVCYCIMRSFVKRLTIVIHFIKQQYIAAC